MTQYMYKVLYGIGSPETQIALFTEKNKAEEFEKTLKESSSVTFVSLSVWTWKVEIEN